MMDCHHSTPNSRTPILRENRGGSHHKMIVHRWQHMAWTHHWPIDREKIIVGRWWRSWRQHLATQQGGVQFPENHTPILVEHSACLAHWLAWLTVSQLNGYDVTFLLWNKGCPGMKSAKMCCVKRFQPHWGLAALQGFLLTGGSALVLGPALEAWPTSWLCQVPRFWNSTLTVGCCSFDPCPFRIVFSHSGRRKASKTKCHCLSNIQPLSTGHPHAITPQNMCLNQTTRRRNSIM